MNAVMTASPHNMRQYSLNWQWDELIVDLFAGGGGMSTAIKKHPF